MRDRITDEINRENGYGVFLLSQMDSVPETLQFIIATTEFDEEANGLRDRSRYVVRAIGVQEHRVSMGIFKGIGFKDDHPLLYAYNTAPVGVFFRGTADHPHELVLDIFQAYASTFGPWHHIPEYLNASKPLLDLVKSGGDLLGEMPRPLADQMETVLRHHGLETKLLEAENNARPPMQVMLLDDSYVIAMDFSVDELGKA
jgi:hypothetical protein